MSEMEGEKKDKFDTKRRNTVISFMETLKMRYQSDLNNLELLVGGGRELMMSVILKQPLLVELIFLEEHLCCCNQSNISFATVTPCIRTDSMKRDHLVLDLVNHYNPCITSTVYRNTLKLSKNTSATHP